ncbi:glycine betaine/proline transport system permease protein [Roseovarius halotolerans]|uniref:Glycine betaine/L-proline transport system permease protein ProW n=1 Tax=Roseovarius halotolerans TaxID=505353 RepID=A0A1X6YAU2_9RHOB|nr:proline/glycine betaine ABC transporter permease [Roseovarius halotolerans]RKT35006.1 glycine betaine/proline transport system permease protein [Roseovarius halotolerans]SLN15243.1 Glycine betaine/L-proline transport system permease protein ProW [Roseovarius halotolerans]
MWQPSDSFEIPLDTWVEAGIKDWLVPNFREVFQAVQTPIALVLDGFDMGLQAIPMPIFTIVIALVAWSVASRGLAAFTLVSLALVDLIGVWSQTMTTLAMILTAVLFCALVGVPLGIAAARRDGFEKGIRPVLDIMQTIPPFVYLVPIVMLFGVGMTPGIIATIIFALPPIIRLTNLGIRSVPADLIEAAYAFGSSPRQVLWEVQLPLALRTIMAGLNQTLMLALSMTVIAALIGAGGLGLTVYTGLGRLDVGAATEGGLGIVLLAMILDRITQALGSDATRQSPGLLETLKSFFRKRAPATSSHG